MNMNNIFQLIVILDKTRSSPCQQHPLPPPPATYSLLSGRWHFTLPGSSGLGLKLRYKRSCYPICHLAPPTPPLALGPLNSWKRENLLNQVLSSLLSPGLYTSRRMTSSFLNLCVSYFSNPIFILKLKYRETEINWNTEIQR